MSTTASERALAHLGFRPPALEELGAPRSAFERIGVPGADSSSAEIVVGVIVLAALVCVWVSIALSDMTIALRVLCVLAIAIDLLMIVARLGYLLERR